MNTKSTPALRDIEAAFADAYHSGAPNDVLRGIQADKAEALGEYAIAKQLRAEAAAMRAEREGQA